MLPIVTCQVVELLMAREANEGREKVAEREEAKEEKEKEKEARAGQSVANVASMVTGLLNAGARRK